MFVYSVVEYLYRPDKVKKKCGYCQNTDCSLSQGIWAYWMAVDDYQALLDRGWRRSGKYCYKPVMDKTCCPQYTIRTPVEDISLSKSQKKVLKRMEKFLKTGHLDRSDSLKDFPMNDGEQGDQDTAMNETPSVSLSSTPKPELPVSPAPQSSTENLEMTETPPKSHLSTTKLHPRPGEGPDPSRPPKKKAKLLRLEKKLAKRAVGGRDPGASGDSTVPPAKVPEKQHSTNDTRELESLIFESTPDSRHQLELRLVRSSPRSKEFEDTLEESWRLYKKYQMVVHGDPEDECDMKRYERFLVDSPLNEKSFEGGPGYGSFHQQYWLDGKLICVGVLDILPNSVSSVYLYYDPDYRSLSLGTYSSLREIAFIRSLKRVNPELKFYYLGYYIHACVKMRYKGQYKPSLLLCPETYRWFTIESCLPKLEQSKYTRFADPSEPAPEPPVLNSVQVLFRHVRMLYRNYKYQWRKSTGTEPEDAAEVTEYASLVGPELASRMLLYRAEPKKEGSSSSSSSSPS